MPAMSEDPVGNDANGEYPEEAAVIAEQATIAGQVSVPFKFNTLSLCDRAILDGTAGPRWQWLLQPLSRFHEYRSLAVQFVLFNNMLGPR